MDDPVIGDFDRTQLHTQFKVIFPSYADILGTKVQPKKVHSMYDQGDTRHSQGHIFHINI